MAGRGGWAAKGQKQGPGRLSSECMVTVHVCSWSPAFPHGRLGTILVSSSQKHPCDCRRPRLEKSQGKSRQDSEGTLTLPAEQTVGATRLLA